MARCLLTVASVLCCIVLWTPDVSAQDSKLPQAWLEGMVSHAKEQVEFFAAAYDLDETQVQMLRDEYAQRIREQHRYMQPGGEILSRIPSDDPDEAIRIIEEMAAGMPLREKSVADWLESLLEPGLARIGRRNIGELWHARDQRRLVSEPDDLERQAGRAKFLALARSRRNVSTTASGVPLAVGVRSPVVSMASGGNVVTLSPGAFRRLASEAAGTGAAPSQMGASVPDASPLLPPLAAWRAFCREADERGSWTVPQRVAARTQLAGLSRRFEVVLASDPELLAGLDACTSKKRCRELIAAAGFQQHLDVIFEEFKQRLEAIGRTR